MRRLESGLAKRTHGVRPSEKNAFAPSRGLSPLAKPRWGRPRRGGAGSARPQRGPRLDRDMSPVGHWPFAYTWGQNEMPGHPDGRPRRTRRARPSEKTALRVMLGFSPLGHLPLDCPPLEGRGPHARNEGPGLTETCPR